RLNRGLIPRRSSKILFQQANPGSRCDSNHEKQEPNIFGPRFGNISFHQVAQQILHWNFEQPRKQPGNNNCHYKRSEEENYDHGVWAPAIRGTYRKSSLSQGTENQSTDFAGCSKYESNNGARLIQRAF